MGKKRYGAPSSTEDDSIASREFEVPVQCGVCYRWRDAVVHELCPSCGASEVVGVR